MACNIEMGGEEAHNSNKNRKGISVGSVLMQLYARIFNLSEKNRTTLITFHGHDHPYVFPSSSRYPFSVIEINAQLGLIYLKLKLKKKKKSS